MKQENNLQKVSFSERENERYSRHFQLPDFGVSGQNRLRQSTVTVVGCGGLGSPSLLYLTAAGIGRIRVIEYDLVDRSNLQRQILFSEDDVGKAKLDRSLDYLRHQNPDVEFESFRNKLCAANVLESLKGSDIVLDGTDNFSARYLINDATVKLQIPLVSASVLRFEGQLGTFNYQGSGCYRCLFSEPPTRNAAPSCAEAGVLGVVPGIMGCMQANEAIKILANIGENLANVMLAFDFLRNEYSRLNFSRQDKCQVCSLPPDQIVLSDLDSEDDEDVGIDSIHVRTLEKWIEDKKKFVLIDVRDIEERNVQYLRGSIHIPLNELIGKIESIRSGTCPVVIYCKSGSRSLDACKRLSKEGKHALNLSGGLDSMVSGIVINL